MTVDTQSFGGLPFWTAILGVICGFGLLTGCSGFSSPEKPLPDSTFRHVLTELHLATAREEGRYQFPPGLRDSIFARHGVRPSTFDAALRYYSRHPKAFEALYQSVIDTLQALRVPHVKGQGPTTIPDSVYRNRGGRSPSIP